MNGFSFDLLPSEPPLGTSRVYRQGSVLWARNKPVRSILIVRRGEIEVVVPRHNSQETVIRLIKPGEICGLSCFCTERKDAAHTTGRAVVRTEVLEIPRDDFMAFLKSNMQALFGLLTTACDRLGFAEERIRILSYRGAEDRIIALLHQLAESSGRPNPDHPGLVRVQYTHSGLARLCGMNRAHVSVILGRLRERDIVRYGRGVPTQIHMPALFQYMASQPEDVAAALDQDSDLIPPSRAIPWILK